MPSKSRNNYKMAMKLTQRQVQHLYARAGFGISYQDATRLVGSTPQALFQRIVEDAQSQEKASVISREEVLSNMEAMRGAGEEARKKMRKQSREKLMELNIWWLNRMATSNGFLREKLTLFWHDHFACRLPNPYLTQQQHNTLRSYALTNFGKMLHAIAKDPAMLQFLNNQQNRKQSPNENFAREVMELFTLGRGNYTETDIKEAARAFTGWGFNLQGEYVFRRRQHDFGEKTVFGKTAAYSGEDILDLLLNERQTARFITEKLFRYFVSEQLDEAIVSDLAQQFYLSDYNITQLLERIFTADWFYEERFIGNKIKSPVELIATMQKQFAIRFDSPEPQIFLQKVLGQMLLFPPSVAGWPEGREWIDSSTLMFRMRLSELIFKGAELQLQAKDSGDVADVFRGNREFRKMTARLNWRALVNQLPKADARQTLSTMQTWLLQQEAAPLSPSNAGKFETMVQETALAITQLPEYQLC